jgi:hypothetical protein
MSTHQINNPESHQQLKEGLQQFIGGKLGDQEARELVRQAGISTNQKLIPLLKQIIEATTQHENRRIALDALYSLWQLKEPREYFLANARLHQQRKWLAYHSILILGSEPEHEETLQLLKQIKAESQDNHIRGGVAEAERVQFLSEEYANCETLQQKCHFILRHFRGGWNPLPHGSKPFINVITPQSLWSQKKLYDLSNESPEVVANAVLSIDLSNKYGESSLTQSYQSYLAQFLSTEAQRKFRELEKQSDS